MTSGRVINFVKRHKKEVLTFFVIFCLVILVYYPLLCLGFFSDDYDFLWNTRETGNVFKYFLTNNVGGNAGGTYSPIFNLLFWIEYKLFGLNAYGYHVVSLFTHALIGFFIFLFGRKFFKNNLLAVSAGILFIFLQSRTEALAWISVQTHLFAVLFYIVAIYYYYSFLLNKNKNHYSVAIIAGLLSILTKEIGITFILAFAILDIYVNFGKGSIKKNLLNLAKKMALPAGLVVIFLAVRYYVTTISLGYYGSSSLSFGPVALADMFVMMTVNMLVAFPNRLVFTEFLLSHWLWFSSSILIFLVVYFYYIKKFRKEIILLSILYIVTTFPFLQLLFNHSHDGGERYTYLASIWFSLFLVLFLYSLSSKFKKSEYITLLIIIFVSFYSFLVHSDKLGNWQLAKKVRDELVTAYVDEPFSAKSYSIVVGLPDNLNGAELFRNSIFETLAMHTNFVRPNGDRILMNTILTQENFDKELVSVQKISDSQYKILPVNDTILTGLPKVDYELGSFYLNNFTLPHHIGDSISVNFDEDKVKELQNEGKEVQLVYFSGSKLRKIILPEL